jgi:predicted ribosomally synthesized peptide with SipW-like signal peptide
MKKILTSLVMILMVAAVATGATVAQFSDTETSYSNTFTAGTLDLKVDDQDDPLVVHITRTNLKPYPPWSHSYGGQWALKNAGSVPGTFSMEIRNIKNYENTCNEPEVGDTTCGVGTDQGELGGQMFAKWSRNVAPWGGWGSIMNPLNSAEGVVVTGDVLNPGDVAPAVYLDLEWDDSPTNNLAQSDSVEFDIVFKLVQTP